MLLQFDQVIAEALCALEGTESYLFAVCARCLPLLIDPSSVGLNEEGMFAGGIDVIDGVVVNVGIEVGASGKSEMIGGMYLPTLGS